MRGRVTGQVQRTCRWEMEKKAWGEQKKVKGKRREQGNLRRKGMVSNWKKNSNEA